MKEFPSHLRQIPAINAFADKVQSAVQPLVLPHSIAVETARSLASHLRAHPNAVLDDTLIRQHLDPLLNPGPQQVMNGTGILLHTNLGRAPLPIQAIEAAIEQTCNYTALEFDLFSGKRGHRDNRFAALAKLLWHVEDATLVNNAAAAVTLALASIAKDRETVISRGELIEIGGSFRMPDIMNFAGTRLVEVGTTNKTKIQDYRNALGSGTGCLFKAHPSNYRIEGFTQQTSLKQLAELGREKAIPVIMDLGSGLSKLAGLTQGRETTIEECLSCGPDLIIFSGDKLLGGVQAGLVLGKKHLIQKMRRHPMMRMVRVDKLTHAIVAHQLRQLALGKSSRLMSLANQTVTHLKQRAQKIIAPLPTGAFEITPSSSYLGGGSIPGKERESVSLVCTVGKAQKVADIARTLCPPLIGHIQKDAFLVNLASVFPDQDDELSGLLKQIADQV